MLNITANYPRNSLFVYTEDGTIHTTGTHCCCSHIMLALTDSRSMHALPVCGCVGAGGSGEKQEPAGLSSGTSGLTHRQTVPQPL